MAKGGTTTVQQAAPQTLTQDIPQYMETGLLSKT